MLLHNIYSALLAKAVRICNYRSILSQLGAHTALHVDLSQRPCGGPNLIDSESSNDGIMSEHARSKWATRHTLDTASIRASTTKTPPRYEPTTIEGIPCYSNGL